MKHTFLHFALPLAFVAALPIMDIADNMAHHRHGQELAVLSIPPPALAPWDPIRLDTLHEEKMDKKTVHFSQVDAARAGLELTTLHMAREALVNVGSNDAAMDLAFNLEYGLADISANSASADADINNDFNLDNELVDLAGNTSASDAEINAQFVDGK